MSVEETTPTTPDTPDDVTLGGNTDEQEMQLTDAELAQMEQWLLSMAEQQQTMLNQTSTVPRWVVMVDTTGFNIVQIAAPEGDNIGFDTYDEAIVLANRLVLLNDNQMLTSEGKIVSVDVAEGDEISIDDDVPQGNGN